MMRCCLVTALFTTIVPCAARAAPQAATGFYVDGDNPQAQAKTTLVVMVRDGRHTVLTIASDARGRDRFAWVIPLPAAISPGRSVPFWLTLAQMSGVAALGQPMLLRAYDDDPCFPHGASGTRPVETIAPHATPIATDMVTSEVAQLSGRTGQLEHWLGTLHLTLSGSAATLLARLRRQHISFIATSVSPRDVQNGTLPAVQLEYDAPDLTLPILTLGTDGPQDILLLVLSRKGRVVAGGPRNQPMPTGATLPEYVADQFDSFYDAAFSHQVAMAGGTSAVEEFAGPVTGDSPDLLPILTKLGVASTDGFYLTRLHLRYDPAHPAAQPALRQTTDTGTYPTRYRVQVAWKGLSATACTAGFDYRRQLIGRWQAENAALAALTGRDPAAIRKAMVAEWESRAEQ